MTPRPVPPFAHRANRSAWPRRRTIGPSTPRQRASIVLSSSAGRGASGARFRFAVLRPAILLLDPGIDLLAMHLDLWWSLDSQLHLAGADLEHGDLDRITDPDVLA